MQVALKRFLYDTSLGCMRPYCNALITSLVPVGEPKLAKVRDELLRDGCIVKHSSEHGLVMVRKEVPPGNRTDAKTERAVQAHFKALTILLPEARAGRRLRKCYHPDADNPTDLCKHFNSTWQPELPNVKDVSVDVYNRLIQVRMHWP